MDASIWEEFKKSHFAQFIEGALTDLGISPVMGRAGRDLEEFHQGSALIRVFVFKRDYLVATSPHEQSYKTTYSRIADTLVGSKRRALLFGHSSKPNLPFVQGSPFRYI